jgi:hypothetical protein
MIAMATLEQMVDKAVTIDGTARNAAGGAVVLTDDRTPVYVDGLAEWDRAVDGKKVRAKGTLRKRDGGSLQNAKGEYSHGVPGARFVLEQPSWTVA